MTRSCDVSRPDSLAICTATVEFTVKRLNVQVPSVREFQRDYEDAVPDVPTDQVALT